MHTWKLVAKLLDSLRNFSFLTILLICCLFSLFYREYHRNSHFLIEIPTLFAAREDLSNHKRILLWTKFNAQILHFTESDQPGWLTGCRESRCLFLTNRSHHSTADAVFFSMPDFLDLNDKPSEAERKTQQFYVFYLDESPDTPKELMPWQRWGELDNFFNLTMTYRSDSDVVSNAYLMGYQPHFLNLSSRDDPLWFQGKRDILWFVSHCKTASKREDYVRKLSHYVKVDEYGKCDAPDPCKSKKNCKTETLLAKYKFYLSFENSFCKDYVTEKLIRALNNDVVPVVLGAANYTFILPKSAFINIENYKSPKQLAAHLTLLMENETLYERHLAWKYPGQPLWRIPGVAKKEDSRFCKLCQLLHRPEEERIQKIYPDIKNWWFQGQCREPIVPYKTSHRVRDDSYLTQFTSKQTELNKTPKT